MPLDIDGYPSEDDLVRIREWKVDQPSDARALLEFVRSIWHPTYGSWATRDAGQGQVQHILVTGGWSGCEDIIRALDQNVMFTVLCWQRSERGGLHEYRVPVR